MGRARYMFLFASKVRERVQASIRCNALFNRYGDSSSMICSDSNGGGVASSPMFEPFLASVMVSHATWGKMSTITSCRRGKIEVTTNLCSVRIQNLDYVYLDSLVHV